MDIKAPLGGKGLFDVRNKSDLKKAKKKKHLQVNAFCPKCATVFPSILANAELIIKHGCLLCSDKWIPHIGLQEDNEDVISTPLKESDADFFEKEIRKGNFTIVNPENEQT